MMKLYYAYVSIIYPYVSVCMYLYVISLRQDFVFFIPPPPHYRGTRAAFSPSVDDCWYGRVNLIFKMRVRTDAGSGMDCQCALIETLYDYCPREGRTWWPSTAEVGTKLLYMPSPDPVVYIVPLSHILGRLPLLPKGNFGTIPRSMSGRQDACFPRGICDREGRPGSGSPLYYINTWAMIWPTDYPIVAAEAAL
jgi:hypothetical protein